MKNILFISFKHIDKINSGSSFRTFHLVKTLLDKNTVNWLAEENSQKILIYNHYNLRYYFTESNKKVLFAKKYLNSILRVIYFLFGNKKVEQFYYTKKVIHSLKKLKLNNIDAIILSYFAYSKFIMELKKIFPSIPIIIDTHDIQYERYRFIYKSSSKIKYLLKMLSLNNMERDEKKALLNADIVLAVSKNDENKLNQIGVKNVLYLPQAININNEEKSVELKHKNIAFFGEMSSEVNIKSAINFYKNIFPVIKTKIPTSKYFIIGANPTKEITNLESSDLVVTGFVENIENYFTDNIGCLVCLFESSYGQRTRILEVMSFGIPCVVNSNAVSGMYFENKEGIFIIDDKEEFIKKIVELLTNKEIYNLQSKKAKKFISDNYNTNKTFGKINQMISDL